MARFYLITEVSGRGLDVVSCLEPVNVIYQGFLSSKGADSALATVIVGTKPFLKDGEGELVVVGEEDHEAVAGGGVELVPPGRGL